MVFNYWRVRGFLGDFVKYIVLGYFFRERDLGILGRGLGSCILDKYKFS